MAETHTISLKIGASHGLWQYKISGTHERIILHGPRDILNGACRLLGLDLADRSEVYLFTFSSEAFEDWQVCLEKRKEMKDGCIYRAAQSNIGTLRATGHLAETLRASFLRKWPERIYFRIDRSLTGAIVSQRRSL